MVFVGVLELTIVGEVNELLDELILGLLVLVGIMDFIWEGELEGI